MVVWPGGLNSGMILRFSSFAFSILIIIIVPDGGVAGIEGTREKTLKPVSRI